MELTQNNLQAPRHLKHNLIGNEFGLRKIQFKFNLTGTLKNG